MLDQTGHDRFQPRIFAIVERSDDRPRDGIFVDVAHRIILAVDFSSFFVRKVIASPQKGNAFRRSAIAPFCRRRRAPLHF
ncbi:MAG: hypothetical protein ACRYGG_04005 [Janthinobacterium lividum]